MLPGEYVLFAMAGILPLAIAWLMVLQVWRRLSGDGKGPRSFSLWSGGLALGVALLLQFQMTPQTVIPSPDSEWLDVAWILCLVLFVYGLQAVWVGALLFGRSGGTRAGRVPHCDRCGNREHLHTEYCVRCGQRFAPRRPTADIPPAH